MTRISSYPPIPAVSPVEFEIDRQPVLAVEASDRAASFDPITRIADDLSAERITGDEAVERILEEVMDEDFLAAAPAEVVAAVREVLGAMVETSPHLADLSRFLGARGAG